MIVGEVVGTVSSREKKREFGKSQQRISIVKNGIKSWWGSLYSEFGSILGAASILSLNLHACLLIYLMKIEMETACNLSYEPILTQHLHSIYKL